MGVVLLVILSKGGRHGDDQRYVGEVREDLVVKRLAEGQEMR